jgi:hypothetical protein
MMAYNNAGNHTNITKPIIRHINAPFRFYALTFEGEDNLTDFIVMSIKK